MILFVFKFFILFHLKYVKSYDNDNYINFDAPDLVATIEPQSIQLKAYQLYDNEHLFHDSYFNELKWYSMGNPVLININNPKSDDDLFYFTSNGFYTHVQLLTYEHKKLFTQEINKKYEIDVRSDQIETLPLSSFKCKIKFYEKKMFTIYGNVSKIDETPLKLDFIAKEREKDLFKKKLKEISFIICEIEVYDFQEDIILYTRLKPKTSLKKTTNVFMTTKSLTTILTTTLPPPKWIRGNDITHWGYWHSAQYCIGSEKAVGFKISVEYGCGGNCDDTALNGIGLWCSSSVSSRMIADPEGYGDWGTWKYCPNNGKLIGFRLRVEPYQGKTDDTGANDLDMMCNDGTILYGNGERWGSFSEWKYCPQGLTISGYQSRIEPQGGSDNDDTGLNNVGFYCS